MIKRIQKLKGCGIFRDFSWPASGLDDCKRFNLVFGWNGTGKSTLSGILRQLELRERPEGDAIEILFDSGVIAKDEFRDSDCSIKVFNRDFVRETVEGEMKPISVFGKENLKKKQELDALEAEGKELQLKVPVLRQKKEKADKELDRFCIQSAKALKDTLGREGNRYASYNKGRFKAKADELAKSGPASGENPSEQEQEELLKRTRASYKEGVAKPSATLPDIAAIRDDVALLRKRAVVSEAIDELTADAEVAQWVQQGLSLHAARESQDCFYCGQTVPAERVEALKKHFSDAVTKLQGDIEEVLGRIDATQTELTRIAFPRNAEIADHLAERYAKLHESAKTCVKEYCEELSRLRGCLEEKQLQLFETLSTSYPDKVPSNDEWEALLRLVDDHNLASQNHSEGVAAAQRSYENARVRDCLDDYVAKVADAADATKAYDASRTRLDECRRQAREMRAELLSHRLPAKELTADLARYLGHNDLVFEPHAEGYRVTRRGQLAQKLSDGERTAIAVLYFLKTFADDEFKLEDAIVVFDDPVSSLDSNALYNAFAFIKDRSRAAKQVLILTHNFPFFRMVREWFKNLRKPLKNECRIFMIDVACDADGRNAALVEIDSLLAKFHSEYQYLFSRVHHLATNHNGQPLEYYLPAPNIARRVLEAFLAFKAPDAGSLYAKMEAVDGNEERRSRLYRFCNMQSHLDAVGDYDEDLSSLSGAPGLLQDVLQLIEEADPVHFKGMVACLASP